MKILIKRQWFTNKSTIGIMRVDDEYLCYTLEDVARPTGVKVFGMTCIPAGVYQVVLDYSNRFKRVMPHILDVPRFTGIRIHPGNTDVNTEGCVLVGLEHGLDAVWQSKTAFEELLRRMKEATEIRKEKIELEIVNVQIN